MLVPPYILEQYGTNNDTATANAADAVGMWKFCGGNERKCGKTSRKLQSILGELHSMFDFHSSACLTLVDLQTDSCASRSGMFAFLCQPCVLTHFAKIVQVSLASTRTATWG